MTNRIVVMISIILAMLIASMDSTIINTVVFHIAASLHGEELIAWSFSSYIIVATVMTPIAGRISDLYGRKLVFGSGILVFLIGSLLCGMANSMLQLIFFRAIQGLGAGIMMPFPVIIAGDLFSVQKRGVIQAFFSAMWGLSAILAPLLGSLFVEQLSWRWIFYINVPICILALLFLLPYKEVYEPRKAKVDVYGALLAAASITLLLMITMDAQWWWLYLLLGLTAISIFIQVERRHPSPMIPLDMLHDRTILWMIVNGFFACASLFGTSAYVPELLQQQGYSIFISGLVLLGMSLGWMLSAVPIGKLVLKYGYRRLLWYGNLLLVIDGFMMLFLHQHTDFLFTFLVMFVQGLAYGMIFTTQIIGAQQLVSPDRKGISTSLQMLFRSTGQAVGITIMGTFVAHAANYDSGFQQLAIYAFVTSLVALASIFFLKEIPKAKK